MRGLKTIGSAAYRFAQWIGAAPYPQVKEAGGRADRTGDHSDIFTQYSHRELLAAARSVYNQFSVLSGACDDFSNTAIGNAWQPQFQGKDTDWGSNAEEFLSQWFKICDVRGFPFELNQDLRIAVITLLRDGEFFVYLTRSKSGMAQVQFIEAHRIGERSDMSPNFKYAVRNGIAYNRARRPVYYHFLGDSTEDDKWVPAKDIIHVFDPKWFSQGRGVSRLVNGLLDWDEIKESRRNESFAQRLFSAITLKRKNATGAPDPLRERFQIDAAGKQVEKTSEDAVEFFNKGDIQYLQVNNEDLEAFNANRPTVNQREFQNTLLRGAFVGLGWSYEQAYDASGLGGASIRRDISKNQRSVEQVQALMACAWQRIVGYSIAIAMQPDLGLLDPSPEWFRFKPQMPAKMSADAGNEAKADIEGLKIGTKTHKSLAARDGEDWIERRQQKEVELDDLLERAKRVAEKHGITLAKAMDYLEQRSPNLVTETTEKGKANEDAS